MSVTIKVGGAWKEVGSVFVKVGGAWKEVAKTNLITEAVVDEASSTNGSFSDITDTENYRLGLWTANGNLEVTTPGFLEVFVVGGGARGRSFPGQALGGSGGSIRDGWYYFPAGSHAVTVAAASGGRGNASIIGSVIYSGTSGAESNINQPGGPGSNANLSQTTTFHGTSESFGIAATTPRPTYGDGGYAGGGNVQNGGSGRVMVRWSR